MLNIIKLCAAICVSVFMICCASSSPPTPVLTEQEMAIGSGADSLDTAAYEDLFVEIHADIVRELARREKNGRPSMAVVEARSIVKIAEEIYLEGNHLLAIKLLHEAELLLRQAP